MNTYDWRNDLKEMTGVNSSYAGNPKLRDAMSVIIKVRETAEETVRNLLASEMTELKITSKNALNNAKKLKKIRNAVRMESS